MKIAVIGGAGKMGRWLVKYLKKHDHKIVISDIHGEKAYSTSKSLGVPLAGSNRDAVEDVDLVVVSVPVELTPNVIDEVATSMRVGSVLMEVTSIKRPIIETLNALLKHNLHPLSIHPLFGPGAEKLENLKIAVIPIADLQFEENFVKNLFPEADVTVIEADEHDKTMAAVLSLPYFINLALASTIADEDINLLKRMSGTTFTLQLLITESVLSQDPQLHTSLHFNNPDAEYYMRKFLERTETLISLIKKKDRFSFEEFYEEAGHSLRHDKDFYKAYKRMYTLLEKLFQLK